MVTFCTKSLTYLFGRVSTFFCETGRGRLQIGGKTGAERCGDGIFGCSSIGRKNKSFVLCINWLPGVP